MGLQTVYTAKYNVYFNRLYRVEQDYTPFLTSSGITNVSFNPNDGVNTTLVVNTYNLESNYLLVYEGEDLKSRWFIIEAERLVTDQYKLTLRRDLFADYMDEIEKAPIFVEKAYIRDQTDPAIFNKENMTFNQIKKSETPLKDETLSSWIVGYVSRNENDSAKNITLAAGTADAVVSSLPAASVDVVYGPMVLERKPTGSPLYHAKWNENGLIIKSDVYTNVWYDQELAFGTSEELRQAIQAIISNGADASLFSYVKTNANVKYLSDIQDNVSLDGKTIYDSQTSKYYKVSVSVGPLRTKEYSDEGGFRTAFRQMLPLYNYPAYFDDSCTIAYHTYSFTFTEVNMSTASVTIPATAGRKHLQDSPYDMFCIPLDNVRFRTGSSGTTKTNNGTIALNMACEIATQLGANIYDLQLLPYCPLVKNVEWSRYGATSTFGRMQLEGTSGTDYNLILDSESNPVSFVAWCSKSSGTIDIPYTIDVSDPKIENETEFYRLCSPNYNGVFEFSAAKNGGVRFFNVDYNYRPSSPYIHVNPNFGNLYGQDFNDARGLVCGGDFSLPIVNDAWVAYQNNNKNYQLSFDRQIENMEINNSVQRTREIVEASIGAIGAGMRGVSAGSTVGPAGAVVGGIVGGAASVAAGVTDIMMNEKLRAEGIDFSKDMFGYNLGNIAAQPRSIAKVSAYTYNNKIFPLLEFYTCTDVEKQALRDKIKYNGMTVMRIGKIGDYVRSGDPQYFKGQLIRLDIGEDNHLVNEIANELNKGVFV